MIFTLLIALVITAGPSKELKSLPYLTMVPAGDTKEKQGVVVNREEAYPGLNLFTPRDIPEAFLIDMDGNVVHSWRLNSKEWQHVALCPNGDLLVIIKYSKLIRLAPDSSIVWEKDCPVHHDVICGADGKIYTFFRRKNELTFKGANEHTDKDYLVILSSEGEILEEISLYDFFPQMLPKEQYEAKVLKFQGKIYTHANSVVLLERDIEGLGEKGDILISLRDTNVVAVIDHKNKSIKWSWGWGELDKQHHATVTGDNVLIFDNGTGRNFSRVIEVDPRTRNIIWDFRNPRFFSTSRGGAQRLPNGNTLITDSDNGRVFEITSKGKMIWEYYTEIQENNTRPAIFRMHRLNATENAILINSVLNVPASWVSKR
jgi:arylsulfotransferase ASST